MCSAAWHGRHVALHLGACFSVCRLSCVGEQDVRALEGFVLDRQWRSAVLSVSRSCAYSTHSLAYLFQAPMGM